MKRTYRVHLNQSNYTCVLGYVSNRFLGKNDIYANKFKDFKMFKMDNSVNDTVYPKLIAGKNKQFKYNLLTVSDINRCYQFVNASIDSMAVNKTKQIIYLMISADKAMKVGDIVLES